MCSFVGAFSNGLIAFVLPPIFYIMFLRKRRHVTELILNIFILMLGMFGSGYCSVDIILTIIRAFTEPGGQESDNVTKMQCADSQLNSTSFHYRYDSI